MPIRVMLADDHQVFVQGLASLLQSAGMDVLGTASDRSQLLQMILADPPNVSVVDIGMPGVSISQMLTVLRDRNVQTALLVLTGSEGEFVEELLAAGVRGYMLKEHAFEELRTAIRAVAAGKIHISPQVASELILYKNMPSTVSTKLTLTARQLEILRLIAAGHTSKRIASQLGIHIKTVDNHRHMLRDRLSVNSTAELIRVAMEHGLI